MEQFERFEFRPWMGYVVGITLYALAWDSNADVAMVTRGLGMTLFFGTGAWHHRQRRVQTGAPSVGELKSLVFAGLCGLLTLGVLVELIIHTWRRLVGE